VKKSRFTEEQIAFALKQAETGTSTAKVLRRMGISEQTCLRGFLRSFKHPSACRASAVSAHSCRLARRLRRHCSSRLQPRRHCRAGLFGCPCPMMGEDTHVAFRYCTMPRARQVLRISLSIPSIDTKHIAFFSTIWLWACRAACLPEPSKAVGLK